MKQFSMLAAGAAVAVSMSLSPAIADGYETKGYGHHKHVAAPACDAAKFGGAFVGIHGGSGTLHSTETELNTGFFLPAGASNQQVGDGLLFGGQIGYNFARCNTVFGIEADFSWANINSSETYGDPFVISHSLDWLASLRTKGGIAIGDVFLYATGGIAFAKIDSRLLIAGTNDGFVSSDTRVGWVAGVGSEYALTDRVRLTADVLYYDFGTNTVSDNVDGLSRANDHHSLWVTRVGLNFKLGDGASYAPMK